MYFFIFKMCSYICFWNGILNTGIEMYIRCLVITKKSALSKITFLWAHYVGIRIQRKARQYLSIFKYIKKHTTDVISGIGNGYTSGAPDSPLDFSGVRLAEFISFRVMFSRSLFVLVFFFTWSLHCLSFDLRLIFSNQHKTSNN